MRALLAGGSDLLLVETIFDSLNAKAALLDPVDPVQAAEIVSGVSGRRVERGYWGKFRIGARIIFRGSHEISGRDRVVGLRRWLGCGSRRGGG